MDRSGSGKQTPAEARRQRLAASLRSNLRRRKNQGRSRAGADEAAGAGKGHDTGEDRHGDRGEAGPDGKQT
jgi:hypothetical protein